MKELKKTDRKILGICNGFQILCEAGLLPGTLRINQTQKFICKPVTVIDMHNIYTIPVAHAEGNYYHPDPSKINIEFTYTENINGSIHRIAGVSYANVLGMMPHPERAFETYHCSQDGIKILEKFYGR